jgi:hypothetical protein
MLDEEHFLSAGREAGARLCQFMIDPARLWLFCSKRLIVIPFTPQASAFPRAFFHAS